jgi:pimeloyl-ACP methyl ester carboxylesterase
MRMTIRTKVIAVLALATIAVGLWRLEGQTDGIVIRHVSHGAIPVTVFRAESGTPGPVVVIAHGFAGSRQLMLPFANTLAHAGFTAVTFDQPGHGRNPQPLRGGVADNDAASQNLLAVLREVMAFARTLPGGDRKLALLGHSMASDIVVRAGQEDAGVAATIAVSMFSPAVTATTPANLLVIDGALEPPMLTDEATRAVGLAADGHAVARTTYGSIAAGTARRFSLSGGVEHIGVLYSRQSLNEAVAWLCATYGMTDPGFRDDRPVWLGVLYLGLIVLAFPLSRLLPTVAVPELGAGLRWKQFLPLAILPAILTPLILWKLPSGFLPILLGDYLTLHFGVYGLLTLAGLVLAGRFPRAVWQPRALFAALAVAAYCIAAIGLPLDRYADNFTPILGQLALMPAVLAGTLLYFGAEAWLTAGVGRVSFAPLIATSCFIISLAIAVSLNLRRLFFLIIIIPVILIFLAVFRSFASWTTRQTGQPLAGGLALALAFAWAIAVTFPRVG